MKKILIVVIGIALIVGLAVIAGKNAVKNETKQTNTSNTNSSDNSTPKATQTPQETEVPSEEPTEEPTTKPDTSSMSSNEKIEYAKSLAKSKWEKIGLTMPVTYVFETILNDGKYMIRIENNASAVDYCYVDINTGTAELETYN